MSGNINKTVSTVITEAVFSKDNKHRYLLRKSWDNTKPKAAIILLYPGYANTLLCDTTTMLTNNQITSLGFGAVDILNIFSLIGSKDSIANSKETSDRSNDEYIITSAKEADKIIIATGRGNNKAVIERTEQVIQLLEAHKDKLYFISDGTHAGYHPLSPRIRYDWKLVGYMDTVAADNGK